MRTILEHKTTRLLYRIWFLTDLADLFCFVHASKTISYTGWQVDGLGPQRLKLAACCLRLFFSFSCFCRLDWSHLRDILSIPGAVESKT